MSGQPTPPHGKGKGTLRRSRAQTPGLSADALFDPATTVPTSCPVGHCQAIRLPNQQRVPTCAHDLDREHGRKRPRECLNAVDPATSDWGGF